MRPRAARRMQYQPSNTAWTYSGSAGVAANGGTFTSSTSDAPDDNQVAFVEKSGSLKQTFVIASGNHMLSFQVAQAESVNESSQQLRVSLLGPPTSAKSFVWSGNTIAEERDSSGANVKKRFFAEGEQRVGGSDAGNYYYSRDYLGSIREVTDSTGALKARYDYNAWGKSVVVSGNMNLDFGYTGHYFHAPSGLNLALYRAYDATIGRWASRDPLAEAAGVNLYGYVANDPLNRVDLLGLEDVMVRITQMSGTVIWYPNPGLANPVALPARIGMIVNLSGKEAIATRDKSRCEFESLNNSSLTRLGSNSIYSVLQPSFHPLLHVPLPPLAPTAAAPRG